MGQVVAVVSEEGAGRALAEYEAALARAPLADQSRRAYRSRVAGYLTWLASDLVGGSDLRGNPLADPPARDYAVAEYQDWVRSERGAQPSTVNAILTALDHFYGHLRLGPVNAVRAVVPEQDTRVLDDDEQRRFLRAALRRESVRDQAIAHALFYTGVRVAELVALDLPDVRLARTRSPLVVVRSSQAGRDRTIPISADSRPVLRAWVRERSRWPGASAVAAVFLNRRGGRLTARSVDNLVIEIGREAGIAGNQNEGQVTPQVLRHTFATRLLRGGTEVALVAELLGHKRLDTTRRYGPPPTGDRVRAIELLRIDH